MPPTIPTIAFVVNGTCLSPPVHGLACFRRPRISSCSFPCSVPEDVTIINESSVSRFAEREFRFVEPNKVATGAESDVGDSHMPTEVTGQHCLALTSVISLRVPFAWYVQFGLDQRFSWTPLPLFEDRWRLAAITARMKRCSNKVYPSGIRPERPLDP